MTEYELRPRSSNNILVCFFMDVSIFIFFYPECKNSDIGLNLRFAPLDVTEKKKSSTNCSMSTTFTARQVVLVSHDAVEVVVRPFCSNLFGT